MIVGFGSFMRVGFKRFPVHNWNGMNKPHYLKLKIIENIDDLFYVKP